VAGAVDDRPKRRGLTAQEPRRADQALATRRRDLGRSAVFRYAELRNDAVWGSSRSRICR
jgi:hypothetical protein